MKIKGYRIVVFGQGGGEIDDCGHLHKSYESAEACRHEKRKVRRNGSTSAYWLHAAIVDQVGEDRIMVVDEPDVN